MRKMKFWKMAGAGNDFIVIDVRGRPFRAEKGFIRKICTRRLSVGADGVILLDESKIADFRVHFYNSDGSVSRFCGNGSRCAARYAFLNGIAAKALSFEGDDGTHSAVVRGGRVRVSVIDAKKVIIPEVVTTGDESWHGGLIDTGVPHFVVERSDIEHIDMDMFGKTIRYHARFRPAGINVDCIRYEDDGSITIRTYERGIEGETLSCGSGCVAATVYAAILKSARSPLSLHTRSQIDLQVFFKKSDGKVYDLFLEGDARILFRGEINSESVSGFSS